MRHFLDTYHRLAPWSDKKVKTIIKNHGILCQKWQLAAEKWHLYGKKVKKTLLKCEIFIENPPTQSFIWLKMINFARVILIMCTLCQTSSTPKTRHYVISKN